MLQQAIYDSAHSLSVKNTAIALHKIQH